MPRTPPGAATSSLDILVVDDEAKIRTLVLEMLTSEGHHVQSTECSLNALALIRRRKFDIVISDVRMPHISGIELTRRIRQTDPAIKVILMSGHCAESFQVELDGLIIDGYVSKPFRAETIIAAVDAIAYGAPFAG